MATLRQRTSFGPGIYRGHKFDRDRLLAFVEGTNKAIAAGVPIPLLLRHAPINADDSQTQAFASEPDKGAGFITKVELEPDGSIAWEADGVPDPVVAAKDTGHLKFTSPEFRNHYECEKAGVYSGPVIRHFAFTPTPGNPHQGAIETVALSEQEGCWQFSESDIECLQFYEESKHYKALKKAGFKFQSKDVGGWRPTFEHPETGEEATIHFDHSNSIHGKLEASPSIKRKLRKHYEDSQHEEEEEENEQFAELEHGRLASSSNNQSIFRHLVRQHGGDHHPDGSFSIPKHRAEEFHKAAKVGGFKAGKHYHMKAAAKQPPAQFDEDTHHKILTQHGWHEHQKEGGATDYVHDKHPGIISVRGGDWAHSSIKGDVLAKGKVSSLHKYLTKSHSTQHNEKAIHEMPNADDPNYTKPEVGSRVKIKSGTHEGKEGEVVEVSETHCKVKFDDMGDLPHDIDYKEVGPVNDMNLKSQHAEQDIQATNKSILRKHGWSTTKNSSTDYVHPDLKGHIIRSSKTGWVHLQGKDKHGSGDEDDLNTHLHNVHSGAYSFAEQVDKKSDIDNAAEADEADIKPGDNPESPPSDQANPDILPKATDKSKLQAVIAIFAQLGMILPSDFDLQNENAIDLLIASGNTLVKSKTEAESKEAAEEEEEDQVKDAPMPFSETEAGLGFHHVLKKHGYELAHSDKHPDYDAWAGAKKGTEIHLHDKMHHVELHPLSGRWVHHEMSGKDGGTYEGPSGSGKGAASLHKHLTKFHTSQHEEVQFSDECDDEQFDSELGELGGTRYKVVRRSAKAPQSGGGKYRRAVHVRVYDSTHPNYTGKGSHGLLKEWSNVDARYDGPKSEHGKALHEAHKYAAELNAHHEGQTQQYQEAEVQFSEEELQAMPAKARQAIEAGVKALKSEREAKVEAEKKAIAFAEEQKVLKNEHAKKDAIAAIDQTKLPPVLKNALKSSYENIQFSEGVEQPVFTAVQVAALFSNAIPKHLQFEEDDEGITEQRVKDQQFFEESPTPQGGAFHISAERANEIIKNSPLAGQYSLVQHHHASPSVAQLVKNENAKHPNNVMRN